MCSYDWAAWANRWAISTSAWPRMMCASFSLRGRGLAGHGARQRLGDDHVAHLDGLDRDAPGVGSLVDELLELRLDLFAAAQEHRQRRAADDVAERGLRAQLTANL